MTTRRYLDQRLRLHLLRAVDAIERNRSLLKASVALGVSQPALTKSLHELEDILQLRLFDRHPRGVYPTEGGIVFVRSARRILAELRRLDEELDLLSSPGGGTLALGALPVAASGVLPGALARLKAAYPAIRVRLQQGRTEELLPLLASGELDLIVGRLYEPAVPDGFAREALWSEPISVLARAEHPIFSLGAVTVEELGRYDLVLPTATQRVGQEIEHLLSLLGIDPAASLRSSSHGFIREMLHGTDLLSVMPRLMMVGDLLRGTLRVVPLPIPTPDRPAGLILPRGGPALRSAGLAFAECLRAYVAEIAERGVATSITNGDSEVGRSDRTGVGGQG
ncbi:MAG TPA: LysR substrate-binding domain-containing protein [Acetobacteraceae bacterium]|nr:LysR substrate-binding domain-containing protein [Acetobacteraceae bacterium]